MNNYSDTLGLVVLAQAIRHETSLNESEYGESLQLETKFSRSSRLDRRVRNSTIVHSQLSGSDDLYKEKVN